MINTPPRRRIHLLAGDRWYNELGTHLGLQIVNAPVLPAFTDTFNKRFGYKTGEPHFCRLSFPQTSHFSLELQPVSRRRRPSCKSPNTADLMPSSKVPSNVDGCAEENTLRNHNQIGESRTFFFGISSSYIQDWDRAAAFREIYQN